MDARSARPQLRRNQRQQHHHGQPERHQPTLQQVVVRSEPLPGGKAEGMPEENLEGDGQGHAKGSERLADAHRPKPADQEGDDREDQQPDEEGFLENHVPRFAELGVSAVNLQRWCEQGEAARFRPVAVDRVTCRTRTPLCPQLSQVMDKRSLSLTPVLRQHPGSHAVRHQANF